MSLENMMCTSRYCSCSAHCDNTGNGEVQFVFYGDCGSRTSLPPAPDPTVSGQVTHQTRCNVPFFGVLEASNLREIWRERQRVRWRFVARPTFSLGLLLSFGRPICTHTTGKQ